MLCDRYRISGRRARLTLHTQSRGANRKYSASSRRSAWVYVLVSIHARRQGPFLRSDEFVSCASSRGRQGSTGAKPHLCRKGPRPDPEINPEGGLMTYHSSFIWETSDISDSPLLPARSDSISPLESLDQPPICPSNPLTNFAIPYPTVRHLNGPAPFRYPSTSQSPSIAKRSKRRIIRLSAFPARPLVRPAPSHHGRVSA